MPRIGYCDATEDPVTSIWTPSVWKGVREAQEMFTQSPGLVDHIWVRDSDGNVVWEQTRS